MQSSDSSLMVVIRALVMLSCLVIAPLAAIFGRDFPEVVKSTFDECLAKIEGRSLDKSAQGKASSRSGHPARIRGASRQADSTRSPKSVSRASAVGREDELEGSAAVYQEPAGREPSADSFHDDAPPYRSASMSRDVENRLAPEPRSPAGMTGEPARPEGSGDQFGALQRKLREYGATYYLLETWGNEGELFRFHCKMSVGDSATPVRQFEATDRDAVEAIAKVVDQVEAWRENRQ